MWKTLPVGRDNKEPIQIGKNKPIGFRTRTIKILLCTIEKKKKATTSKKNKQKYMLTTKNANWRFFKLV